MVLAATDLLRAALIRKDSSPPQVGTRDSTESSDTEPDHHDSDRPVNIVSVQPEPHKRGRKHGRKRVRKNGPARFVGQWRIDESSKPCGVRRLKYWGLDTISDRHWFYVYWADGSRTIEPQCVLDAEDTDPNFRNKLDEVRVRGHRAKPLETLGSRGKGPGDCVWRALSNLLPLLPVDELSRLRADLSTNACGLSDVLRLSRKKKSGWWAKHTVLPAPCTTDAVLRLRQGLYLVVSSAHCVAVDANQQLVYDGSDVLSLSLPALTQFGVNDTCGVGIVSVNYAGVCA